MKRKLISKSLLSFALLAFCAAVLFAQETAREKEISRLFDSGEINLWEKRFPQALADFQKALRLDPTNNSVHYYFGRIYLESGDYDQATAEFEKHLQQSPDENWSVAFIGEAFLKKGDADRAVEYLTEKIAADDSFAGFYQIRAEAYLKKNLIDEAIADYTRAKEISDQPAYLFRRAAVYAQKGDQKSALRDYLALLENFPDYERARREALKLGAAEADLPIRIQPKADAPNPNAARLFQNAFDRLMEEDKDAGIYFFGKAAAADPKFATPIYYRGLIYDTQVLYGKAFEEFKKAYAINPNFVEPRLKYADRVGSNGYFEVALAMYERILEINPQEARAFAGRGAAMLEQSRIFGEELTAEKILLQKQAVNEFDRAIELNPKLAAARLARGEALYNLGKLPEAVADYTAAIANSRSDFITSFSTERRASAYCSLGELEKARADAANDPDTFSSKPCQDWAINQAQKPPTAEAWLKRGSEIAEDKNFAAAIEAYDESLKIKETAEGLTARGKTYLLTANYDAANNDLSKAITLNPNHEEAYKLRAVLYQLQDKNKEAISDLSTLIRLKPDNAFYHASRAALYAKTGQSAIAVADYTKAVGIESDYESEFRIRRGDLYLEQKKYRAAIADYNAAVEEMPLRISLYPKRAAAYCALGDKLAARANWQTYKKHGGQKIEACR